ncbi:MAG: hypothetical protein QXH24_07455 [Candidatus Bathyarchaeia archaeon]
MKLIKAIIIIILFFALIAGIAVAIVSWSIKFTWTVIPPQTSSLVCYEIDGTTILRTINWGTLEQGKTYTYSFIIKNNGTTTLTLHLNKPNNAWVAGDWGYLSWDKEGYVLNPGETVTATLTWQISSTAPTGSYSSDTTGVWIGIEGS